jgi:hypothetical protein
VGDIAWKAQVRLCGRYRKLLARGKHPNTITAAIARELAAFMWAIAKAQPLAAGPLEPPVRRLIDSGEGVSPRHAPAPGAPTPRARLVAHRAAGLPGRGPARRRDCSGGRCQWLALAAGRPDAAPPGLYPDPRPLGYLPLLDASGGRDVLGSRQPSQPSAAFFDDQCAERSG